MSRFTTLSERQALDRRPKKLPPVEPELEQPKLRPMQWSVAAWAHHQISPEVCALLESGDAARAWVTHYHSTRDSEGTDHYLQYAFEYQEGIHQGRYRAGIDDLHLAFGAPEYAGWMGKAFKEGSSLTVLFPEGKPERCRVYGTLQLFVSKNLLQAAAELRLNKDPKKTETLVDQFLRLALGPLGKVQNDWREYYNLLKELDLFARGRVRPYTREAVVVRENILAGCYKQETLEALSEFCVKYHPGIWAAR